MTRRLWFALISERRDQVLRSRTGINNRILSTAWASHYADRGLLLITIAWLVIRVEMWSRINLRPEESYEPLMWLGRLVFPELPHPAVWYGILGFAFAAVVVCLLRPRWLVARIVLTASLLLLITPEYGFGHLEHVNHLFLLAHVYSVFRPLGRPQNIQEAEFRAAGYTWFLLGLLAIYTASGLWKVVDMTIRDVIKPGVTWLNPDAMLASAVAAMRNVDLPMILPSYVEAVAWAFPIGYVVLTLIFSASFLAAFRRPLLIIVVPVILVFHFLNAVTLYALFLSTIVVASVVLLPYDYLLPTIKGKLIPVKSSTIERAAGDATYQRRYENGDVDTFIGFFAYREWVRDRAILLSAPLYYPGVAWAGSRLLDLRRNRVGKSA